MNNDCAITPYLESFVNAGVRQIYCGKILEILLVNRNNFMLFGYGTSKNIFIFKIVLSK